MKIKIEKKEETEIEVFAPLFFRAKNGYEFRALFSENDFRELWKIEDTLFVKQVHPNTCLHSLSSAISDWDYISELDFITAWHSALEKLSLTPKLIEK
jgi:hypothetical protein